MILIVLKAQIRPEKRAEWLDGIARYTADVLAEPGSVSFDYYESATTPNEFVIVETFADAEAGAAHVATDHARAFFPFMATVLAAKPQINYQDLDGDAWSEMAEVSPE